MSEVVQTMNFRLDGKTALVTGASSGIGQGIAIAMAEAGADVSLIYRTQRDGAETTAAAIRDLGRQAFLIQADVGMEAEVEAAFEQHFAEFGRIDILVNNAGISIQGALHEISFADFNRVLQTNLFAAFYCSRYAVRSMIAAGKGGRIINISSVHEEACWENSGPYNVSKGGLRNLTRTQAVELGPHGITANDIAPGMIATQGLNRRAIEDPEFREASAAQIVARRVGMPEDIGAMAVFLASDAGSYCTGSTHYVDGGWMLTYPPV